jgi:hypothetical protein
MTERPGQIEDALLVLLGNRRLPLATLCAALGISEAKARAYLERVREGREGEHEARRDRSPGRAG